MVDGPADAAVAGLGDAQPGIAGLHGRDRLLVGRDQLVSAAAGVRNLEGDQRAAPVRRDQGRVARGEG